MAPDRPAAAGDRCDCAGWTACARSRCSPSWHSARTCPGLPGGFLGVDVFFVLSGYLITDLLVARFDRDGRLDLRGFWSRPGPAAAAALAVVLVTVAAP